MRPGRLARACVLALLSGTCRPATDATTLGRGDPQAPAPPARHAAPPRMLSGTPAVQNPESQPLVVAEAKPERFASVAFPPPDIEPPHQRSAQPGDGVWRALGTPSERVWSEPAFAMTTVVHPHEVSKWAKLTVVVMDQRRLATHYVPGHSDLEDVAKLTGTKLDAADAGLVPASELDDLLVVFNGGFKPRHGRWGMKSAGRVLLQPRDEGCTVAVDDTATISVGDWASIRAMGDDVVQFRQTPPCLLRGGRPHEQLEVFNERPWGGFDPKRKTRRRSALGVDSSGRWLFYAIGEEMGPRVLAEGMGYVGAKFAAELDINWSWTRFLLFSENEREPKPDVSSTLIPEMVHRAGEYVDKPAARGFFYVTLR